MKYDIVNVKMNHPSYIWVNGLYIVIERTKTELSLCKLDKDGNPTLDDGSFSISRIDIASKEVYPTKLSIELDNF